MKAATKKPAVKAPAVKKEVKPKPAKLAENELWEIANSLENTATKLAGIRSLLECVAEANTFNSYSSALWTICDMLESVEADVDFHSDDVMYCHRKLNGITTPAL